MKKTLRVLVVCILLVTLLLVVLVGCRNNTANYKNAKKYKVGGATYDAGSITAIDVAWTKGAVNIIFSDEYTNVTISEENSLADNEKYTIHQYVDKKGTLWVRPYAADVDTDNLPTFEKKILTITAPKVSLKSAIVENHNGTLTIDGIQTSYLETYNLTATTDVKNAKIVDLKMSSQGVGAGLCRAQGAISGDITIGASYSAYVYTSVIPKSINMSAKRTASVYIPDATPGFMAKVTPASKLSSTWEYQDAGVDQETSMNQIKYGNMSLQMKIACATFKPLFSKTEYNSTYIGKYSDYEASQVQEDVPEESSETVE